MEYCHFMNEKFKLIKNGNRYRFGRDRKESSGYIPIRVLVTNSYVLSVIVDVVSAVVPFLTGL